MSEPPMIPELSQSHDAYRAGRFLIAAELAAQARRKKPNDPEVLLMLGRAMARSGNAKAALVPLKKIVSTDPSNPLYRYELAHAYDAAGRVSEALGEIEAVLESNPDFDRAIQLWCSILRGVGRGAQAWDFIHAKLDSLPRTPILALTAASILPAESSPEGVLERLRESIADPQTTPSTRRSLFYALAKVLDRQGEYTLAFAAAESANRLFPKMNLNQHQILLDRLTPELLGSIEPAGIDTSLAVLVCGMPRSGTTLTEQILAAHPEAATVGESPLLGRLIQTVITHAKEHGFVPTELTTKLAKQYLKHLREDSLPQGRSPKRVIDKMPQNLIYLGVVDRLLPGCRVIRCVRDPRDTALSCYFQDFHTAHPYRSTFASLADELIRHEQVTRRWKKETRLAIHTSSLEQLTADPNTRARELVEFMGLPFDEACLQFHETGAHVKTASTDQIRSGINTKGQGRWKHYEKQLAPLIALLEPILPGSNPPSN